LENENNRYYLIAILAFESVLNENVVRQQPFFLSMGGPGIFWKRYFNALADRKNN
jgi:hypothetical protein